jgi:2-desacetyl-2-hydroxyethyl bacteriochlorophyllide A dehydrogenase
MPAAYYTGSGQLEFRPCEPRRPGPLDVRIEVAYGGVCGSDLSIYRGLRDERMLLPEIIGHEMSGTIAEVGADAEGWKPGDRVVVMPFDTCGDCRACQQGHFHICYNLNFFGVESAGAFQDSWTVPAHTLHSIPDGISLELAALVEPVAVAVHAVRASGLRDGDFAVVLGGGPIGLLTALVAHDRGGRVLLSEVDPFRVDVARGMGLEALDPTADDLQEAVLTASAGSGADIVFEVSGSQAAATIMSELLCTRGLMLVVAIFSEPAKIDLKRCFMRELRLQAVRCYNHEDFREAIDLIASGRYPFERMITARVPIEQLPGAFQQMESGAPVMKTLLTIGGSGP